MGVRAERDLRAALRRRLAAESVVEEGSCQLWVGCLCDSGYPRVSFRGHSLRRTRVYEWLAGDVPPGWLVASACGRRNCIDLDCLQPFPRWALMSAAVGRKPADVVARMTTSRWRRAIVGMDGARQIRQRRAAGELVKDLAREYGISRHSASDIGRGISYRERNPFSL